MPSYLKQAMDNIERETDGFFHMAGAPSKSGAATIYGTSGRGSGASSLLDGAGNQFAEHYSHYKSWPYVAIRAISHRIAGQQVFMARRAAGSQQERARFITGQKSGFKMHRMSDWESIKTPAWVKSHMGVEGDRITQHELLEAIHRPNACMTQWSLMVCTVASIELTGRSFWYISKKNDRINIWPLPSNWVTPIQGDGEFSEYVVSPNGSNEKFTLSADEVAYFSLPDPANPMGSFSPVQAQIRAIETDEAIPQAQDVTFKRGIFPGVVFRAGRLPGVGGQPGIRPVLTADQRKQLYNAVFSAYEGVSNFGEPLIVDGMIEGIEKFTSTAHEMDFQQSGKITKSRILQAFGVNPIVLGEVENANRAQAAVAEENFCNNVVNPLLELMSQVMTAYLAPIVEEREGAISIWIDPAHPHDREQRLKEWTEAAKIGAVSVNEFRTKILNLPPMDGGAVALRPLNFEQVEVDTESTTGAGYRGNQPPKKAQRVEPAGQQAQCKATAPASRISRRDVWDLHQRQTDTAQQKFEQKMEAFLRKMYRSAAAKLEVNRHHLHGALAGELFDPDEWHGELLNTAGQSLFGAAVEGAITELSLFNLVVGSPDKSGQKFGFGENFDPRIDIPDDVLVNIKKGLDETFAQPYWKNILSTTQLDIQSVIDTGIQSGASINEVERAIRDSLVGGRHPAVRANAMARTEMGGALNAGHQSSIEHLHEQGLVESKEWLSVCGNTTRGHHCLMTGEQVGVKDYFNLGGEDTPYPSWSGLTAQNRINCQCTVLSVTTADMLEPMEIGQPQTDQSNSDVPTWNPEVKGAKIQLVSRETPYGASSEQLAKEFEEVLHGIGLPKGTTKKQIASAAGATDGSNVSIKMSSGESRYGWRMDVNIENKKLKHKASRQVKNFDGDVIIQNSYNAVEGGPPGTGTRIFRRQADMSQQLGVDRFLTHAAGDPSHEFYNGYYTWPRLGYDCPIPEEALENLRKLVAQGRADMIASGAKEILKKKTPLMSDLMDDELLRNWWKNEAGQDLPEMTFELAPGSKNVERLRRYHDKKFSEEAKAWMASVKSNGDVVDAEEGIILTDEDERLLDMVWATVGK